MKLKDPRVSLANKPGRRGTHRSGSLDPDLMAQDRLDPDLISGVEARSDGWDRLGVEGGGAVAGAAACGSGSPERCDSGFPGLDFDAASA